MTRYTSLWLFLGSLLAQRLAHIVRDFLSEQRSVLAPHLCSIDICRRLIVGLGQHGHHADEYLFNALHGGPALTRTLVLHRIFSGGVQYADAHLAIRVYCKWIRSREYLCRRTVRVPQRRGEFHLGRIERIIARECQHGAEQSTLVVCATRTSARHVSYL